jgi:hypothetical protein
MVETLLSLRRSTSKLGAWGYPPARPTTAAAKALAPGKSGR